MSVPTPSLAPTPPHQPSPGAAAQAVGAPSLIVTLLATLLALISPGRVGRLFLRVPPWQALLIGALNTLPVIQAIRLISHISSLDWLLIYPQAAMISGVFLTALMMFFVILPFAPRPAGTGPDHPPAPARVGPACLWHVGRTLLLGSTLNYVWYGVFVSLARWSLAPRPPLLLFPDDMLAILGLGGCLLLYSLWVLVGLVDTGCATGELSGPSSAAAALRRLRLHFDRSGPRQRPLPRMRQGDSGIAG